MIRQDREITIDFQMNITQWKFSPLREIKYEEKKGAVDTVMKTHIMQWVFILY